MVVIIKIRVFYGGLVVNGNSNNFLFFSDSVCVFNLKEARDKLVKVF